MKRASRVRVLVCLLRSSHAVETLHASGATTAPPNARDPIRFRPVMNRSPGGFRMLFMVMNEGRQ